MSIRDEVKNRPETKLEAGLKARRQKLKEKRVSPEQVAQSLEKRGPKVTWQAGVFGLCVLASAGLGITGYVTGQDHAQAVSNLEAQVVENQEAAAEVTRQIESLPGVEERNQVLEQAFEAGQKVAELQSRYQSEPDKMPELLNELQGFFTEKSYSSTSGYFPMVPWYSPYGNSSLVDLGATQVDLETTRDIVWTMTEPTLLDRGSVKVMWEAKNADGLMVGITTGRFDPQEGKFYEITVTLTEDGVALAQVPEASAEAIEEGAES